MRIPLVSGAFLALCLVSLPSASAQTTGKFIPNGPSASGPNRVSSGNQNGVLLPCQEDTTNLCIPLDGTFTVVQMDGPGGATSADPNDPCQYNDDDVTNAIPLQFSFDFFGTLFNSVHINNNGNISFGSPFSTFTPSGFPVAGFPMIAPFWGDCDSSPTNVGNGGGTVWFRSEANRFTVIWEHIGYYNSHSDLVNTFQVIITDGTDPLVGIGNNVCFCYDDMQWTTGDASGGVGGFGGTPATVGANEGDGVTFFQVGRFDHDDLHYDGPGGNTDGVSFLDNNTICFDASSGNTPPIFTQDPGTIVLKVGDMANFRVEAIAPELPQTTTISVNSGGLANFACNLTQGGPGAAANASCTFTPGAAEVGTHMVTFTATDDGVPVGATDLEVTLIVTPGAGYCFGIGCPCQNDDPTAGCANSTGSGALMTGSGTPSVGADDLVLTVTGLPPNKPGIFFMGDTQPCVPLPGSGGLRAAGGNVIRLGPRNSGAGGTYSLGPGIAGVFGILPGTTWNFQTWHRDPMGPCGKSNLSNGYCVNFVP